MTAIDTWIAGLLAGRYSVYAQNLISPVDDAVAALQFISGGLPPSGAQANNTFYAGPASGGPLPPTFRALAAADFATTLLLDIGNLNLNSSTAPANGLYLPSGSNVRVRAGSTPIMNFAVAGPSVLSGTFTPISTNGIAGTATNDNANAGSDGEFLETVVTQGAPVAMVTATPKDLATLSLTAGDWDVEGSVQTVPAGATVTASIQAGFNTVLNTLPVVERQQINGVVSTASTTVTAAMPRIRFSLSGAATVRLVAQVAFSVSTLSICGFLNARRPR